LHTPVFSQEFNLLKLHIFINAGTNYYSLLIVTVSSYL
jgi:hypothetical protein